LFAALFLISLVSDVVYGSTTSASSAIKVLLLLGLGTSFTFLFQDGSFNKCNRTGRKEDIDQVFRLETVPEQKGVVKTPVQKIENSFDNTLVMVQEALALHANKERARKQRELAVMKEDSQSYSKKEYLGVNISDIVTISEKYAEDILISEIEELMSSEIHDERIIAIWLLISKYKISDSETENDFRYVYNIRFCLG